MKNKRMLAMLGALSLLLAACGPAQEATPTPTRLPAVATPTATAVPSTPTPLPPGLTPQPSPTPRHTPTPTIAAVTRPKYGGTLRMNLRMDPIGPDPWRFISGDVTDVFNFIHPRLSRFSSSAERCAKYPSEPELSTGWKWMDDKTLEITLRQGVKFPGGAPYNGREFTADDLVYTATVQWPKSSWYPAIQKKIASIQKAGTHTVRFALNEPFADLIEATVEDPRALVAGPELFGADNNVAIMEQGGLGPFRVRRYSPGVKVELAKNDQYWRKGIPYVDQIEQLIVPDFSTVAALVRSGRLDFAEMRGQLQMPQSLEKTNPEVSLAWCPSSSNSGMHLATDEPPFNDVRVRRAASMAIDRQAIVQAVYGDKGLVSLSLVHPTQDIFLPLKDYPQEARQYLEYNPDRARALLAEAGYPQGFPIDLTATTRRRDQVVIAEAVAGMLSHVGIKAKLSIQEWAAFTATTREGRYKGAMIYTFPGEKTALLYPHSSTPINRNWGRVKDPKLDAMLDEFGREVDMEKRKAIAQKLQIYYVEQAYAVPIGTGAEPNARQPWTKGIPLKMWEWVMSDYVMYGWLDR